ncbi:30S ribosomal protein S20 [Halanaerobium salsuginis]|jgi:small subunit ribosomal protein S20|uniref:Small ribosomal subunit protein bS20 n=1 Tax=Halanaerobium salsuginis TaxID=29563 RepID=A0A1I4G8V8_9FIRM|nr:30S ribosomal protein S20 [Halanaerobium salsuginis]SFL25561.1 small subunit ribosomal protein S20 [Halanaerobium salsuginis]
MPIIKSAKKRVKITEKKTALNRERKDRLKNAIRAMEDAVQAGDKEAAAEQLKETKKVIDKAVTRNIIHKNNAARKKSRLTKMYNNM